MAEKSTQTGADRPGYEEARAELIEVVRTLEAGGTTLEESLALWERGEKLATVCQEWLDGARTPARRRDRRRRGLTQPPGSAGDRRRREGRRQPLELVAGDGAEDQQRVLPVLGHQGGVTAGVGPGAPSRGDRAADLGRGTGRRVGIDVRREQLAGGDGRLDEADVLRRLQSASTARSRVRRRRRRTRRSWRTTRWAGRPGRPGRTSRPGRPAGRTSPGPGSRPAPASRRGPSGSAPGTPRTPRSPAR